MVRKSFKELLLNDIDNCFMNNDEFGELRVVDGKKISVIEDEIEIIEREKKMKSNMDGVYVKQKLIYVKASEFGSLPSRGKLIDYEGKKYQVADAADEQGIYSITMEANRTK